MNPAASPTTRAGPAFDFQITRRVEFCDTDMAGIMHFSNFFRFMEAAETAFLRSLGLTALLSRGEIEVCLPRVHAECDYSAPLRFEDEVVVHLLVERKGTGSLTYQFRFYRVSLEERVEVARGRVVMACAARAGNGRLKPVPLPKALAEKVQQAPAAILAGGAQQAQPPRLGATGASNNDRGVSQPGSKDRERPRKARPI